MKKIFFCITVLFLFVAVSCSKKEQDRDSFEYFNTRLEAGMKYDNIVKVFGWPDDDIGSGIHIYVYKLSDGSAIWIGYADKIIYAMHVDRNGQLLHIII
jgi:hypothetical protein